MFFFLFAFAIRFFFKSLLSYTIYNLICSSVILQRFALHVILFIEFKFTILFSFDIILQLLHSSLKLYIPADSIQTSEDTLNKH